MVTETLQYYLFKLFKKISEKFANFYLTLTSYEGALDMPIILCYIMIKDWKPKSDFQSTKTT